MSWKNTLLSVWILSKCIFNYLKRSFFAVFFYNAVLFLYFSSGPIFGAGADLSISSNCNVNCDSYSNQPHSYESDDPDSMDFEEPILLTPSYNFYVADYEVFAPANPTLGGPLDD